MEQGTQHVFNYQLFKSVVTNIANKYKNYFPTVLEAGDIEQELWEKLYKLHITDQVFRELDSVQQIKVAKVVLGNKAIDIMRSRRRSMDSIMDHGASDIVSQICLHAEQDSKSLPGSKEVRRILKALGECFNQAETDIMYEDLKDIIMGWISRQPDPVRTVMREKIFPSEDTLKKWDDLCEKYPRYKSYPSIPGITLCKLLQIETKHWCQAVRGLRDFLMDQGYCLSN